MIYNRILLKLSGEALLGGRSHGIDPKTINKYSNEIKSIAVSYTHLTLPTNDRV